MPSIRLAALAAALALAGCGTDGPTTGGTANDPDMGQADMGQADMGQADTAQADMGQAGMQPHGRELPGRTSAGEPDVRRRGRVHRGRPVHDGQLRLQHCPGLQRLRFGLRQPGLQPCYGLLRPTGGHGVEMSTDGGMTFNKVGAAGDGLNWYNDSFSDEWDGTSGAAGVRGQAGNQLVGAAGQSDVRVRFVFSSDGSVTEEGFSVDDFRVVTSDRVDLAVSDLAVPVPGCGSVNGPVSVLITNLGGGDISGFTVTATGLRGMPVTETVTATIPVFGSISYTFGTQLNVSADTTVTVTANAPNDAEPSDG